MEPEAPGTADLEERLRAALTARSALVTAQSLRPGTPPRPGPGARRRRARLVLAAGVLAAAVTICVVTLPPLLTGKERHDPAPGPAAAGRMQLDTLSFAVPPGWTTSGGGNPYQNSQICVEPPSAPKTEDGCRTHGIEVSTDAGDLDRTMDQDDGWEIQPYCWTEAGAQDVSDTITSSRITERAEVRVSGLPATYRAWQVSCRSGQVFTVRWWYVPSRRDVVRAFRLPAGDVPLAQRLVASITQR